MSNDLKWLIASDFQIPYEDKRATALFFKLMKWWKPDAVDLLGDIDDQNCYSRYSDGRPAEFLEANKKIEDQPELLRLVAVESEPTREFYKTVRAVAGKASLFVALGNHDIRVFDYFEKKHPDILAEVTPNSLWSLDDLGYDYIFYNELPRRRFGDIHVHHGVTLSQNAGESARKDVDNYGVSIMRGHSHRMGTYYKSFELRGETLRGYEIGHMCDLQNNAFNYTTVHNWQQGFAIAHVENGEYPHIQLVEISKDYTVWIDGKKFTG